MFNRLLIGPIGALIALVVWLVAAPVMIGLINAWYYNSVTACQVGTERFDRIVAKGDYTTADAAWNAVTGTTRTTIAVPAANIGYILDTSTCTIAATTAATTFYTSGGSEVSSAASGTSLEGVTAEDASSALTAGSMNSIVKLVLQSAALATPVGILLLLMFFTQNFFSGITGVNPILVAIAVIVVLVLVGTLLAQMLPFLDVAFEAINSYRYLAFSEGLGSMATIIGNFYGVVTIAGIGSVAWSAINYFRASNALPQGAGRRM